MDIYEKLSKKRKTLYVRRPGALPKAEMLRERNKMFRKLTPKQARAIRYNTVVRDISCDTMAKALGVTYATVSNIIRYISYKDCGGPCNEDCELASGDEWACIIDHEV